MLFRDKFLLSTGRPIGEEPSEWVAKVTEGGFRASLDMQMAQMKMLKSGFEHVAQTQADASAALQGELAYQADRLGRQIAESSSNIVSAVEQSSFEICSEIQQMSDYLGAGLSEVRWAVERHTEVSENILRILIESLSNESRQYFEQGVKCYETSEYEFARKTFSKALEANITNHFAYQYLGFIAVNEDNSDEAIRNFDLARKFAENDYHRALAFSHLARSYQATNELAKAVDLAEKATETYPDLAKFWYEFAGYSARLGNKEQAIVSLEEAIERDWLFFTIVAGDKDFDSVRPQVNNLLDSLRKREKEKARKSLDNLSKAIKTANNCGCGEDSEVRETKEFLEDMEDDYNENNVFLYREIYPNAEEFHEETFQTVEQSLSKQIEKQRRVISENENEKKRQLANLSSKLNNLNSEIRDVDYRGGKFDFGLFAIGYIILFIALFFGSCFGITWTTRPFPGRDVVFTQSLMIAAITPLVLIGGGVFLKYLFTKGIPLWSLEQKRAKEEKNMNPRKVQIEGQFDRTRKTLEKELSELETLLSKCKSRQYV